MIVALTLPDVVALLVVLAALSWLAWSAARAALRYRGVRIITCPDTSAPAAVRVDARHAAITAGLSTLDLRLRDCSRWPERRGCGQECLAQIEAAPEECLVRSLLARWYAGKRCVMCRRRISEIPHFGHRPALLGPDGITREWREIAPERLPEALATHLAICWDCHISETFRRRFPELVIDRPDLPESRLPGHASLDKPR